MARPMKVDGPRYPPDVFYSSLIQSALTFVVGRTQPGEAVDYRDGNRGERNDTARVLQRRCGHDPVSRSSVLRSDR